MAGKPQFIQTLINYVVWLGFFLLLTAILYLFRTVSDIKRVVEKTDKQDESISKLWMKYGDTDSRIDTLEASIKADVEINKKWLELIESQQRDINLDLKILRNLHLQ